MVILNFSLCEHVGGFTELQVFLSLEGSIYKADICNHVNYCTLADCVTSKLSPMTQDEISSQILVLSVPCIVSRILPGRR